MHTTWKWAERNAERVTVLAIAFGLAGMVWVLLTYTHSHYLPFLIGMQFGGVSFVGVVTLPSLALRAVERYSRQTSRGLCAMLDGAILAQAGRGNGPDFKSIVTAPATRRRIGQPFVWRLLGYLAAAAETIALLAIYLGTKGIVIYPGAHPYILAGFIDGGAAACVAVRLIAPRYHRAIKDASRNAATSGELERMLKGTRSEGDAKVVPIQRAMKRRRHVSAPQHHLGETAGN